MQSLLFPVVRIRENVTRIFAISFALLALLILVHSASAQSNANTLPNVILNSTESALQFSPKSGVALTFIPPTNAFVFQCDGIARVYSAFNFGDAPNANYTIETDSLNLLLNGVQVFTGAMFDAFMHHTVLYTAQVHAGDVWRFSTIYPVRPSNGAGGWIMLGPITQIGGGVLQPQLSSNTSAFHFDTRYWGVDDDKPVVNVSLTVTDSVGGS